MRHATAPPGAITAAIPCNSCNGAGGRQEVTVEGGVYRAVWRTCSTCNGTGVRG